MAQLRIDRGNPALWIATFENPPINLIDPDTIVELQALLAELETDADVKVIVFRSADPDFFLAHWDILADKRRTAEMPPGPSGLHPWLDVLVRISRAPVVSIAAPGRLREAWDRPRQVAARPSVAAARCSLSAGPGGLLSVGRPSRRAGAHGKVAGPRSSAANCHRALPRESGGGVTRGDRLPAGRNRFATQPALAGPETRLSFGVPHRRSTAMAAPPMPA